MPCKGMPCNIPCNLLVREHCRKLYVIGYNCIIKETYIFKLNERQLYIMLYPAEEMHSSATNSVTYCTTNCFSTSLTDASFHAFSCIYLCIFLGGGDDNYC